MNKHTKIALIAVAAIGISPIGCAATYTKNNGIIGYNANLYNVPMISNIGILGTSVLLYDNVGAGFQMTGRSSAGNAYNPTQAGDCKQTPSLLISAVDNWSGNGIGIPSSYGLLLKVQPKNYNQPGATCTAYGALLPYEFDFGATLKDGTHFPQQGMIVQMTVTRNAGGQVLQEANSEFPSMYPLLASFPLAYWSTDGTDFQPLNVNVGGHMTNNISSWPAGVNYSETGKLVMVCKTDQSMCLALYSNKTTGLIMSHRIGAQYNLSLLTLTMGSTGTIFDYSPHTGVKIFAVGTQSTVATVITTARAKILNWGDL